MTAEPSIEVGPDVPATTVHRRVREAAERDPSALAVAGPDSRLTYGELVAAADAWARVLRAEGVEPGAIVAVRGARSPDLVAAMLGVLCAGACYTVVDPAWPADRQVELLGRTGPELCLGVIDEVLPVPGVPELTLTPAAEMALTPAARTASEPGAGPVPVGPDAPAVLFWTSGSTGVPKGVLSPHRATTRLFGTDPRLPTGPGRVMLSVGAPAWDAFTLEVWSMLTTGGTVVLHGGAYLFPGDLRDAIREHGVTHLFLTAGLFDVFVTEDVGCFAGLEQLSVGGDRMSPMHATAFLAAHPGIELVNGYGPVECCVFVTVRRVTRDDLTHPDGVPVGTPVPGTRILVVDDGEIVPRGAEGEIWVTGHGVGLGYLGEPVATAEKFGTVDGVPCYRTGDRARMDDDGTLRFLGRADRQIKIAGHRVEPGEVENAALRAGCRQAAVVPVPGPNGYRGLALFAVPGDWSGSPRDLRAALAGLLPEAMVPWPVRFLDELPLTPNAKVDRSELARSLTGTVTA